MSDAGLPAAPLPFRLLIDEAAKLARRNLRRVYLPIAIPLAVAQAILAAVQLRWMSGWFSGLQEGDPTDLFASFVPYFLFIMAASLVVGLIYVAMYVTCVNVVGGRSADVGAALRFVFRPRVLVTLFLAFFCIGAGTMACILPGIVIALLLGFLVPVMVEEQRFLVDGFSRSGSIATYNPRRSFAEMPAVKIFVLGVISVLLSYAITLLVQVPVAIVQQVMMVRDMADAGTIDPFQSTRWMWLQVPSAVLASLGNTAIQLYVAFGVALLYFDARRRQEGSDLEAAIDQIADRGPDVP